MLPGKIRVNTPVCPDASPLQPPIPNNCSRFPRLGDPDPVPPVSCWVISRTILRVTPNPSELQPDHYLRAHISRTFSMRKRPTLPSRQSSYSAGVSLSAVTGICSASMGFSAGVTSIIRFLARSINSCSCSTIWSRVRLSMFS